MTAPPDMTAQVCPLPAATETVVPESPETATGTEELVVVPLPSSPRRLLPQQTTVPLGGMAQEWLAPAAMNVAPTGMVTGIGALAVPPFPIWPSELSPQHWVTPGP